MTIKQLNEKVDRIIEVVARITKIDMDELIDYFDKKELRHDSKIINLTNNKNANIAKDEKGSGKPIA